MQLCWERWLVLICISICILPNFPSIIHVSYTLARSCSLTKATYSALSAAGVDSSGGCARARLRYALRIARSSASLGFRCSRITPLTSAMPIVAPGLKPCNAPIIAFSTSLVAASSTPSTSAPCFLGTRVAIVATSLPLDALASQLFTRSASSCQVLCRMFTRNSGLSQRLRSFGSSKRAQRPEISSPYPSSRSLSSLIHSSAARSQ